MAVVGKIQLSGYLIHAHIAVFHLISTSEKQIAALLADGTLHSHISARFSFEEIPKAQKLVDAGRTVGKVVIHR